MPRRTIAEMRMELEDLLPSLSDYEANRFKNAIAKAEMDAKQRAQAHIDGLEREVLRLRDSASKSLTATRDALDDLSRDGADARIAVPDYSQRIGELMTQQEEAEAQLARAESIVEQIEVIEEEPSAWFDALLDRTPALKQLGGA